MLTINTLVLEFCKLKSALIFCHVKPDGDTLGSAVALQLALQSKGVDCDVVCDGEIPLKYSFFKPFKGILKPEMITKRYEGHIAVDVASETLLGTAWGVFVSSEKRFCVDHHISNERFANTTYVENTASASIIVYKIINEMGVLVTKEIAEAILIGIITDTSVFVNANTNEEALFVAGKMLSFGANMREMIFTIYKNQSKARSDLYLDVLRKMRFYLQNQLAVLITTQDDLQKYAITSDVTDTFVDYPLTISGVEVAVSLLETRKELYRVSFRSRGKVDVNEVAKEFGGGGHKLASGCVVKGMLEEVIEKIIRAVDINIF